MFQLIITEKNNHWWLIIKRHYKQEKVNIQKCWVQLPTVKDSQAAEPNISFSLRQACSLKSGYGNSRPWTSNYLLTKKSVSLDAITYTFHTATGAWTLQLQPLRKLPRAKASARNLISWYFVWTHLRKVLVQVSSHTPKHFLIWS